MILEEEISKLSPKGQIVQINVGKSWEPGNRHRELESNWLHHKTETVVEKGETGVWLSRILYATMRSLTSEKSHEEYFFQFPS